MAALCLAAVSQGQAPQKESFDFYGTVERVDLQAKRLTVANDPIPGWMDAMTMSYAVDTPSVLGQVKPGDRIRALVFAGDTTLHDVSVLQPDSAQRPVMAEHALTLEQVEQIALGTHPALAEAQAAIREAAGRLRQVGLYPNPTIGYYGDEIRGGLINGGKQGGFVSQTFVTGGKLSAAKRVASLEQTRAQTEADVTRFVLLNEVRIFFYQSLADQRMLELRKRLASLAQDAIVTSRQLSNVGQADKPDLIEAEVEARQAHIAVHTAEQTLQGSWRVLAAAIGKPDLPQQKLSGELAALPSLNFEEVLADALRSSPELHLAQDAVQIAEAALTRAKRQRIPDLQITANLFQNREPLEGTRTQIGLEGIVQIGVEIPIFNRNQGDIEAAKAEVERAKSAESQLRLRIQQTLAELFRDYDSARTSAIEFKAELLPRAEQAYQLYRANYDQMAGSYPQVLISQRTLFQLEAEYVQTLASAWRNSLLIRGFGLISVGGGSTN